MERAYPTTSLYVSLCFASLRQGRVRGDSYERVEHRIELLYAAQARLGQLDWRDFLAAH
jgi:hypothetical protein